LGTCYRLKDIITTNKTMSSTKKGRVVELIVKELYKSAAPGSKIEHDVRLPAQRNSKRKRQIDVLLSTEVIGIPINIAFECKNENRPVSVDEVGDFIDRLTDVGIPTQHGIMISASSFQRGAIERATEVGIQTLRLVGLTPDRLESAVIQAYQSIVYLLADVTLLAVTNNVASSALPAELLVFRNAEGRVCASIPDLIWYKWVTGQIPTEIGEHSVELSIPSHWHYIVNGKEEELLETDIKVRVLGIVITLSGRGSDYTLLDARDNGLDKRKIHVEFDIPASGTQLPVTTVTSEHELDELTKRLDCVTVTTRLPLPRLLMMSSYYPLSERVAKTLQSTAKAIEEGKLPPRDSPLFSFEELEGTDVSAAFEPMWPISAQDLISWIDHQLAVS
jgi:hypothetical protein